MVLCSDYLKTFYTLYSSFVSRGKEKNIWTLLLSNPWACSPKKVSIALLKYLLYKRGETFVVYRKQRNCFSKDREYKR